LSERFVARDDDPDASRPVRSWSVVRAELVRPAVVGAVALLVVAACATHRDTLFRGRVLLDWPIRVPWLSDRGNASKWVALAGFFGGIAVLSWAWVRILRVARWGGLPPAVVLGILGVWCLPLLAAPPLLGRDAYSYAAQGELVTRGLDPNRVSPAALGDTDLYRAVHPAWRHTPAPYGPLALTIDAAAVTVARHRMNPSVIALRVAALLGVALLALTLPSLARRLGHDPGDALALVVLNPLVLLNLVGGVHTDALMLGLLVAGLAVGLSGHRVSGIVLCALAAAVKLPAGLGVLLLGWEWEGCDAPVRARLSRVAAAGGVGFVAFAVTTWLTGRSWAWIGALDVPSRAGGFMAPVNAVGWLAGTVAGVRPEAGVSVARALGLVATLVLVAVVFWRSDALGGVRAAGVALGVFTVLGSSLFPWYFTWSIALLAAAGPRGLRPAIVTVSIALGFLVTPVGGVMLDYYSGATKVAMALLTIGLDAIAAYVVVRGCESRTERARPAGLALAAEGDAA
jgi:hypothetical protein